MQHWVMVEHIAKKLECMCLFWFKDCKWNEVRFDKIKVWILEVLLSR